MEQSVVTEFTLEHPCGVRVERHLTESIVAGTVGVSSNEIGNGYIWHQFAPTEIAGTQVIVCLCFFEGELLEVELFVDEPAQAGSSWADWCEDNERSRAERTKNWLSDLGFPPGKYPWGEVWTGYDGKSAYGFGLIRYRLPNPLVSRDRNPRERGFRPVNSDR